MVDDAARPPTDAELLTRIRSAWAVVLNEDEAAVPLDTNFLEAGGSSLLLIMLWEELHELTEADLRVSHLFQHATVRAQATFLAATTTPGTATDGGATATNGGTTTNGTTTNGGTSAPTGPGAGNPAGPGAGTDRGRLLELRRDAR